MHKQLAHVLAFALPRGAVLFLPQGLFAAHSQARPGQLGLFTLMLLFPGDYMGLLKARLSLAVH